MDDSLSASQLRQRYKQMPDEQLSASQLRARNGIPRNTFNHDAEDRASMNMILVLVAALAIMGVAAFLFTQ